MASPRESFLSTLIDRLIQNDASALASNARRNAGATTAEVSETTTVASESTAASSASSESSSAAEAGAPATATPSLALNDANAVAIPLHLLRQKNVPQIVKGITGTFEVIPTGRALCFENCTNATIRIRAPLQSPTARAIAACRPPGGGLLGAGGSAVARLARVVFVRCHQCQIEINTKILGTLEVFACENTRVDMRAPCGTIEVETSPNTVVTFPPPSGRAASERPVLVNRGCVRPFQLRSDPIRVPRASRAPAPRYHSAPSAAPAPAQRLSPEAAELAAILTSPAPLEPTAIFYDDKRGGPGIDSRNLGQESSTDGATPQRRSISPDTSEDSDSSGISGDREARAGAWVRVPLDILRERDPLAVAAVKLTGRSTPPPYKYYVFEVPDWRRRR